MNYPENGISRQNRACNEVSVFAIKRVTRHEPRLKITWPNLAVDGLIDGMF